MVCNLVNAGSKPLVVESFWIQQLVSTTSYAVQSNGCSGFGPHTIQPGDGCTRRVTDPSICNQPDACFCYATISGSTKLVRASIIGTVSGSTATVTSDLRAK